VSTTIIIVAGGSGTRRGGPQPKQFLPLAGKAILQRTLERFHSVDPTFKYIVVLPDEFKDYWVNHCKMKGYNLPHEIVEGGEERFYSVRNAVEKLPNQGVALVHDAVRPLVSKETVKKVLAMAQTDGAAVPVIPVSDSVRMVNDVANYPVDRNKLFLVQTPQGFRNQILKEAYRQSFMPEFTDDATVVEKTGQLIHLVEGNRENIKITQPADIKLAEFFLELQQGK
jgi:2-C-methyl-D-erythritol 4-phosphate cytidylyltransferase